MKTYTTLRNLYGTLTNNTQTANLTLGDQFINDSIRAISSIRSGRWKWLETLESIPTIANKQSYPIPNNIRHAVDIYVQTYPQNDGQANTNAPTIWFPEIVYDPVIWKKVLSAQLGAGDVPRFVYVQNDTIYFSPYPQSNGNSIYIRGRLNLIDLSIADYTTGTITTVPYTTTFTAVVASGATSATLSSNWSLSTGTWRITFSNGDERNVTLTNGSAAVSWTDGLSSAATATITVETGNGGSIVTGSGTTWVAGMVGRYIKIADTSAANGGDGFWYKINSVESTTILTLNKTYQGTAISGGSATYTIGQVPPIPEAYQVAIVYRAVALYWEQQGDLNRAKIYWTKYDGGVEAGYTTVYGGLISQMMEAEGSTVEGAYIPPTDFYGRINPNNPEPDVASSSFV